MTAKGRKLAATKSSPFSLRDRHGVPFFSFSSCSRRVGVTFFWNGRRLVDLQRFGLGL
jgi:hypothetical protein